MALIATDIDGVGSPSDYGSDFTPDEEEILNGLLDQGPNVDNPNLDPEIQLENVEDDQGCQGIKIPRRVWSQHEEARARIEVDGNQRNIAGKSWSFVS